MLFHVLNRAAKRTVLFDSANDYRAFERLLDEAVRRHRIAIFAYCIMPNHWHFVLTPRTDGSMSRFMHWLTTTHARRWQDARGLTGLGAVYQGRFKAIPIGDDDHFRWVCRYVERNPLRASLVTRAEEWPWSSLGVGNRSWLTDWPKPPEWLSHVNTPQTDAELEHFRHALRNGIPFGNSEWQQDIMRTMRGGGLLRPRGRPRRHVAATVLEK